MKNENDDKDYQYSREVLYDLIEKGRNALEDMIQVARESEHPRAFEVLATMIKNVSDVNDRLMDLNKKNKDINQKEPSNKPQAQIENQQNNIFLGSTAELQKLLQQTNAIDVTPKT